MPATAAVYCRISKDRTGAGLGVERQLGDCQALADGLGWAVSGVYVDNDLSAYTRRKRRPGYQRLLADLRDGHRDGLLVWHSDRLHRSPLELEQFITLIEATHIDIATVTAGEYDLSTPSGRMQARIVGRSPDTRSST